jgi:hypothetical protein
MEKNQCQSDPFLFSKSQTLKMLFIELKKCSWACHLLFETKEAQFGKALERKVF